MDQHDKLLKEVQDIQESISGNYAELDPSLSDGTKKLIMCKHEIVFNIKAHVLEEDEEGNQTQTKEICIKNYHIPVPADKDYHVYMKAFFEHLESCIISSAKHAKEITDDKQ